MANPFSQLHMPAELVCDFLAVFSRFEYALKATGTYAVDYGGNVAAWWDRFARDIDGPFSAIEDAEFKTAVEYLLTKPPRKQVLTQGSVAFVDQSIDLKQARAQQALLMIRTVRNNLFHGGKYLPDGETEVGRNEILVSHSLTVLKHSIGIDAGVRKCYEY